jgi:hypothetical protein
MPCPCGFEGNHPHQCEIESSARRARHRESSPELLSAAGIEFVSKNNGAHLIVTHNGATVDFWPGTGKWNTRPADGKDHRGVKPLIAYLKRIA